MAGVKEPSDPGVEPGPARRSFTGDALLLLLLLIAAAIVYGRGLNEGGFRWPDGPVHAMDGVLLHDWVRAGPQAWLHPREFAVRQYARYPALGLVGIYPPGLAAVEAGFFSVFGVSAGTSRLCVLAFGLAAVAGVYVLARGTGSRTMAVASGVALLSMPAIVYWTRDTMLETPTLAVLTWACVAAQAYARRPTRVRLCAVAVLATAAPLFKQSAAFIVPVLGLWAVWLWRRKRVSTRHLLLLAALVVAPSALYWGLALGPAGGAKLVGNLTTDYGHDVNRFALARLLYYLLKLPGLTSWPILGLGAAGLIVALWRRARLTAFLLVYFVAAWVLMTFVIQYKEPRYFCLGLLPIAVWTGAASDALLRRLGPRPLALTVGLCGAAAAVYAADRVDYPVGPDYVPVVQAHRDDLRGQLTLYEGSHDGGFVFAVRQVLGPRGAVIVRGSKVLYSCTNVVHNEFTAYVKSKADVRERLNEYGFAPIVMERENRYQLAVFEQLRAVLADGQRYTCFATHVLNGQRSGQPRQWTVDFFRPVGEVRRRNTKLKLPVPKLDYSLKMDLRSLASETGS